MTIAGRVEKQNLEPKERTMKMKIVVAALLLSLLVSLAGCTLFEREAVSIEMRWVPNVRSTVMSHWLPKVLLAAEVEPAPEYNVGHEWVIDWGDGTTDQWSDNTHNQTVDPWGNTRVGVVHKFQLPGTYTVVVSYDGRDVGKGTLDVELQEFAPSYTYDEDGNRQLVVLDPWTVGE